MKILIVCTPEYCFSTSQIILGLHDLDDKNIEFKVTEKSNYVYVNHENLYYDYSISNKEAIDYGKEADLIIQTSNRFVKTGIVKAISQHIYI